jgi:ribonucleoside-diphosphate reductase alpha chain
VPKAPVSEEKSGTPTGKKSAEAPTSNGAAPHRGISVARRFTVKGRHPFDAVEWELRTAVITNEKGEIVFEQKGIEFPRSWSQMATNVVASKYFRGPLGSPERERSVRQLIGRVVKRIREWGEQGGYFATPDDAEAFADELSYILLHQQMAFNSPVWFNLGVADTKQQVSACFINSVDDTMESILELAKTEGMLFKGGSGTGTNVSTIRSSREPLAGGGTASGPVSFMRGYDSFAGVIKSGGKTRRAAKMVILNADHPDVVDFIRCKMDEEKKAWALIDAGFEGGFNVTGGAYDSIQFQNANHSVRATDEFMRAAVEDREWVTKAVTNGEPMERHRAKDLLRLIAESTWVCGDPGMQFDTTINDWHTCVNTDRIHASNPCVTGDTLVATADGWTRIDSLVGRTARVIGADGQPHFVTRIFPTGRKHVFRLRTRAGYEVRITGDHKVLTVERGDVPVKDLSIGERIHLAGAGFGRRALPSATALAIGVAVGDGCLARTTHASGVQEIVTLTMAAAEADVLRTIAQALNEETASLAAVGADGRGGRTVSVRVSGTGARLAFSSRRVVETFKGLAVLDEGSERKRFLPAVFDLDRASLAAVLRGLFTADGTVANYGDKSQYVSLDSSSSDLLRQVQVLLLGFGVKSKLYTERRGGVLAAVLPDGKGGSKLYPVQPMYSLRVSRSSRFVFEREIGFDPASPKAAALARLNAEVGVYRDEMTDAVASIEPLGEEAVFDLTEPVTSHFVANGLVVHNCSEYMHLNDSACNLASLNLMRFVDESGEFDVEAFRHAAAVTITAMEIMVGFADYPTPKIGKNAHAFRQLGIGFANLGALLMARGLPYDSDAGRHYAGAISALMSGHCYAQSARIAEALGPFDGYAVNREPMLRVMEKHRAAVGKISPTHVPLDLLGAARQAWDEALDLGRQHGYRNSQISVIAPTGTIAFMMDCDTTGVEPDIALVKYKKLVGGGVLKIVNNTVPVALKRLGYDDPQVKAIVEYIDENGTIEGAPSLDPGDLAVFDCAFRPANGTRSIHYMGHLKMMAAVQPFISGAISKTINVPAEASVEEIMQAYVEAWKLGVKAVAIYRDGSKRSQPLSTSKDKEKGEEATVARPVRRKLPDERASITHKFSIAGHEGYITVGMYEDGQPGEIFVVMAKEGSVVSGLMDSFATAISLALQYGVPLRVLVDKFSHTRFEPAGFTTNPQIPMAKSIMDYIFRWLASKFLARSDQQAVGLIERETPETASPALPAIPAAPAQPKAKVLELRIKDTSEKTITFQNHDDAPSCSDCGGLMVRNGACYKCLNCGSTSGCS